jgi:hypothetical protein
MFHRRKKSVISLSSKLTTPGRGIVAPTQHFPLSLLVKLSLPSSRPFSIPPIRRHSIHRVPICLDSANPTVPDAVHYCCFDSPNMGAVSGSRALFSFDSFDSVCFEWVVAAVSRPIRCVVKSSNRRNGRTLSVSSLSLC